jgi:hypothetical protein
LVILALIAGAGIGIARVARAAGRRSLGNVDDQP